MNSLFDASHDLFSVQGVEDVPTPDIPIIDVDHCQIKVLTSRSRQLPIDLNVCANDLGFKYNFFVFFISVFFFFHERFTHADRFQDTFLKFPHQPEKSLGYPPVS